MPIVGFKTPQSTVKQFYTSMKMADISHAYAMEPIIIFDLSRTQADKIDHVYSLIAGTKIFKPKRRLPKKHYIRPLLSYNITWPPDFTVSRPHPLRFTALL
jgi:hypothetical protein